MIEQSVFFVCLLTIKLYLCNVLVLKAEKTERNHELHSI